MPTSRLETAIAAVKTTLDGINTITGLSVERSRDHAVTPADCPLLVIHPGVREQRTRVSGLGVWVVPVVIEGWVKASADSGLGPASNDLYGRAVEALEADKTLGGAAFDLRERGLETALDRIAGHRAVMVFELNVELRVQTAEGSLSSAPA